MISFWEELECRESETPCATRPVSSCELSWAKKTKEKLKDFSADKLKGDEKIEIKASQPLIVDKVWKRIEGVELGTKERLKYSEIFQF